MSEIKKLSKDQENQVTGGAQIISDKDEWEKKKKENDEYRKNNPFICGGAYYDLAEIPCPTCGEKTTIYYSQCIACGPNSYFVKGNTKCEKCSGNIEFEGNKKIEDYLEDHPITTVNWL